MDSTLRRLNDSTDFCTVKRVLTTTIPLDQYHLITNSCSINDKTKSNKLNYKKKKHRTTHTLSTNDLIFFFVLLFVMI